MRPQNCFKLLLPVLGFMLCSQGQAQAPATNPLSNIEFSGSFDFYYQYSPQAHANGVTGKADVVDNRVFDKLSNEMTVNMVELSAKKKSGKFAFRLDAGFGEMVDSIAGNGASSPVGNPSDSGNAGPDANSAANEPTRNILQATVAYTPVDNLTITAGKFYTHLGYEVTKAKDNLQYSRSYTFNYAIPFWHQGVNVNYAFIPGKMAGTLYLVNAWDGRIATEADNTPSVGANLNFVPVQDLTVNYNYLGGVEQTSTNGRREVHEVNAAYTINSMFTVAADYVMGSEKEIPTLGEAKWSGLAVYLKAQINDWYTLSPRYELFDDSNEGFALSGFNTAGGGTKQKISSVTISNNFNLGDGFESRLEYRTDTSDEDGFKDSDGTTLTDHQESYTAALLYSF